jgi:hypothetical protein
LDEIPVDLADLALVRRARDALKIVPNIFVILAGTNSMAANTIGLNRASRDDGSFHDERKAHAFWSFLFTCLPKYKMV